MKWCERILLMAWLGFCFAIMTEGTLWAGDCSGPDDCGSVPDNNSRAAAGGGAVAGGGLAYNHYKNKKRKSAPPAKKRAPDKPDPCADQRQSVSDAQSNLDLCAHQRQSWLDRMTADANRTTADAALANQALASLKNALAGNLSQYVIEWGWPSDAADFTPQQLQQITTLAQLGGPAAQQAAAFVSADQQLLQDMATFDQDKANWQTAQNNYEDAQKALQQAQQALQDCLASQQSTGGDGGSVADAGAGDSASVPS